MKRSRPAPRPVSPLPRCRLSFPCRRRRRVRRRHGAWLPRRRRQNRPYVQHQDIVFARYRRRRPADGYLHAHRQVERPGHRRRGQRRLVFGSWQDQRPQAGRACSTPSAVAATPCLPCGRARAIASRRSRCCNNLKQGIRWVKAHAEEYKIDPDRLGLTGASAGGHLACLCAATADDGKAEMIAIR